MTALRIRGFLLATYTVLLCCAVRVGAAAQPPQDGPRDQFYSLVYVRGLQPYAEARQLYLKMRPHSLAMAKLSGTPEEIQKALQEMRAWGCRYVYDWFNASVYYTTPWGDVPTPDDPWADVGAFHVGIWQKWEQFRAAGVVAGERPGSFDALIRWSPEQGAEFLKSGVRPTFAPDKAEGNRWPLCLTSPDVRRIIADITRFRAGHGWGKRCNGFMWDTAGTRADCYCDRCQREFDRWVRTRYSAEQIGAIFRTDPGRPVPMLPPDKSPDLARVYAAVTRQFFAETMAGFFRLVKEAAESVLGKGKAYILANADTYDWRSQTTWGINAIWAGDALLTYCSESADWPGVRRRRFYAAPALAERRTNLFDYQYGAGRFTGEPVMVKAGYHSTASNLLLTQAGMAEGLALLGNAGLYVYDGPPERRRTVSIPGEWVLPMVEFAQAHAARYRQMIPAGEVGILLSPVDLMANFAEHYEQAWHVGEILQRQHVPFQMVHLTLLDRHLRERPLRTIIVPWLRCFKDEQWRALGEFRRAGGNVILVGECGTHTWEAVKRDLPLVLPEGRGRSVAIPDLLDAGSLAAHQAVQRALFAVHGATPSLARPDSWPHLLLNLTRNSDSSRIWLHLMNYDVDRDETEPARAVRPAEHVRVVIPLPPSRPTARSVRLFCPGQPVVELPHQACAEGVIVTVGRVEVYVFLEVETAPGARTATSGLPLASIEEALEAIAKGLGGEPSGKELAVPPGVSVAALTAAPRGFTRDLMAYVSVGPERVIRFEFTPEGPAPAVYNVYALDGRVVASGSCAGGVEAVAVPEPGAYAFLLRPRTRYSIRFTHVGAACFEAGPQCPLHLWEAGDSPPLYFYVPQNCRSFKVACDSRHDRARLYALRLVVKDAQGQVVLDETGPFDGLKFFEVNVPAGQAGRVWSLVFLNAAAAPGQKGKAYARFYLDGVSPLVASQPGGLLIARGAE